MSLTSSRTYTKTLQLGVWTFGLLALLHLAAYLSLPYLPELGDYLWGGRVEDPIRLMMLEGVSITVLMLGASCFLILNRSKKAVWRRMARSGLVLYTLLFALNTLGNLMAKTPLERSFSLLTAALGVLCGWTVWASLKNQPLRA